MGRCQSRVEIKLSRRRMATSVEMIPANLAALQPPFFNFPTEDGAPSFGLTATEKVVSGPPQRGCETTIGQVSGPTVGWMSEVHEAVDLAAGARKA